MDATVGQPPIVVPSADRPTTDHPGRWIGGLIGALASLALGVGTLLVEQVFLVELESLTMVSLLGVPIGFVLGRAALPWARGGGWRHAAVIGLALGWLAPPLGAIEIVLGMWLEDFVRDSAVISCSVPGLVAAPILLMYAVPVSFIAIVVTIPVGIAWGLATHALPDRWLQHARMPHPIAALGIRHGVLVLAVVVVTVAALQIAMTPGCPA